MTRSALIATKDQTLTRVVSGVELTTDPAELDIRDQNNPLSGEIGWSVAEQLGDMTILYHPSGADGSQPAIASHPAVGVPFTAPDKSDKTEYRVLVREVSLQHPKRTLYLAAWSPLTDVSDTIDRIILLEIALSLGLLIVVGVAIGLVIRREMRPLEAMAEAADEIASGDLSRRVAPGDAGTEIGRLGAAFNGMVEGVTRLLNQQSSNEERLRQFVADASHELRTPMAAVRGYSDLYQAGALQEEGAVARAMERMGFESHRMGALIEDLLTLTQTDSHRERPTDRVDLVSILSGVVDDASVIDSTRNWRFESESNFVMVLGDELRLHQLFANLLANVRTHTPPGSTATIRLTSDPELGHVRAEVADDGPGVAPENLPRLFDRFFRVDKARSRDQGGSGLGLSIVAAIVRMHHGRVWASAGRDGGLVVTVQFPLAPRQGSY